MAVLSVKELHQRRRSSIKNGKRTHVRVFLVTCDDIHDGTAVALVADDGTNRVPFYGEAYPGIPSCVCGSIDADPVQNSGVHFEVTCEYTDGDLEAIAEHPLDRPADISWGATEGTEPYFYDHSNPPKPSATSSGESFEQLLERECGEMCIQYINNIPDFDANEADTYKHTTNAETIYIDGTGYAPGTLKLSPIQCQKMSEVWQGSEVTYYRRTCSIKTRRAGWKDKPLDLSLSEAIEQTEVINGVQTLVKKLKPILDKSGTPVRKPYPLDGAGRAKPSATDPPVELERKPYEQKSWIALGFE